MSMPLRILTPKWKKPKRKNKQKGRSGCCALLYCKHEGLSLRGAAFSGMGISHGLKTCHRHVFLTAFRFPYGKK